MYQIKTIWNNVKWDHDLFFRASRDQNRGYLTVSPKIFVAQKGRQYVVSSFSLSNFWNFSKFQHFSINQLAEIEASILE